MSITSEEQRHVAANRLETFARSMFAIKGLAAPGPEVLSPIIAMALARLSPHEVRHPDDISVASIGDLHALVQATQNPRPFNLYGRRRAECRKGQRIRWTGLQEHRSLQRGLARQPAFAE